MHSTYHPHVWWSSQVETEWLLKHPQRSIDLFKRGKRERLTEWLLRFIVHHAARDYCASVSRRVILGDILFHNAAVQNVIMRVILIFTVLYLQRWLTSFLLKKSISDNYFK